jgi:hypothetical protein
MTAVETWTATIYVGRYCKDTSDYVSESELKDVCQKYCDEVGLCVTFTPTIYIYSHGNEPGVIVGMIQYPRFPTDVEILGRQAMELAKLLQKAADQERVTIVFPKTTVMLSREIDL